MAPVVDETTVAVPQVPAPAAILPTSSESTALTTTAKAYLTFEKFDKKFDKFPNLPVELRLATWELAGRIHSPRRIVLSHRDVTNPITLCKYCSFCLDPKPPPSG